MFLLVLWRKIRFIICPRLRNKFQVISQITQLFNWKNFRNFLKFDGFSQTCLKPRETQKIIVVWASMGCAPPRILAAFCDFPINFVLGASIFVQIPGPAHGQR